MLNLLATSVVYADDFDWAGWYVGAELGHNELQGNWKNRQAFNPDGSVPVATFTGLVADSSADLNSNGTIGGINVGYNWVVLPQWVVGVEAKWLIADHDKDIDFIPGLDPSGNSSAKITVKDGAALKIKGGYLVNTETMLYASTGIVYQRIRTEGSCPADTFVCNPALGNRKSSDNQNYLGWTLGAGVERAFAEHWIGRLDYAYTNFESNDFTALQFENGASFGSEAKLNPDSHSLTVGVGYKF
ncbi:MAG TPA: outer membrane beta-barrel protein [Methylotenera sp.]|nr:outer membrane beta-barrel protein [Methylotenera sp.]